MENIFEMAMRSKFRFEFKGCISTEDLFDLSLSQLNIIFQELDLKVEKTQKKSLLEKKTKEDDELNAKIEIVKYIFNLKQEEENARLKEKEKREMKQKLYAIKASKEELALQNKSAEEIQKMIDEL